MTRRAAGAGLALVVLVAAATLGLSSRSAPWPSAVVREGRFTERLVERGSLAAARLMVYGSPLAGVTAKIAELAPEGSSVAGGDLLIRFDGTLFEQEGARETAALAQAEGERTRAAESLRLERLQAAAEVDQAVEHVQSADSELADETGGGGRVKVAEAEAQAAEASRDVARARTAARDLQPLLAEGFITRAELDRAEQAAQRAEEQRRLADLKLQALNEYGRPAALDRAKAGARAARESLQRRRESAAARVAQQQAALAQADARVAEIRARVALIEDRLARLVVRAGGPGLVVYRDLFFGGEHRKPQAGDEVFPNQPIIVLPDSGQLVVETEVREADLHKVSASQRVHVRVDAYPDLRLRATVVLVGALAGADAARAGVKTFPVTVRLLDSDPRLRAGMTARVEIEVAARDAATIVPVEAVFQDRDATYCVVSSGARAERRAVVIAAENGVDAVVHSGVERGETVLLADPSRSR